MRRTHTFTVSDVRSFRENLLAWAQQFEDVAWLDGNGHVDRYGAFDAILAVDAASALISDYPGAFKKLRDFRSRTQDWIFGYLSYDLKNDLENLKSSNPDGVNFPEIHFFHPKRIIRIRQGQVDFLYLETYAQEMRSDFEKIVETSGQHGEAVRPSKLHIRLRTFKESYFNRVAELLGHIQRGDIYEANYCQEFYAEDTRIDALATYHHLNAISKAPFAAFLKFGMQYLLSTSPERYLRKKGIKIISQPIKGTAKRSSDPQMDAALRMALQADPKERSENIMIVDLVRNDLSVNALRGSVKVEELCEVYSFEQVHQMISTVTALVDAHIDPVDIIEQTFPMGSMTGAPKISAMKIIEKLEGFKRGVYSGAVGYFTPFGDFDFNVVIRSILYDAESKYVSYAVGSAITAKSDPQAEYEECLLKAKAMREVLEHH